MMNMRKLLLAFIAAIVLSVSLNACGKKLPDPVERKDGYAWIPIADTAFLVPEKTWLKSYGRKSTDGSVGSFNLHVTAPGVQPWSEAVNKQMYPERGRGAIVEVSVTDVRHTEFHSRFPNFPQGTWGGQPLQERPSDLADKQLRKFIDPSTPDTLFYEYVQDGKIKYRTMCDEPGAVARRVIETCVLSFPWGTALKVEFTFNYEYLPESVNMADKIAAKLKEFETAGRLQSLASVTK